MDSNAIRASPAFPPQVECPTRFSFLVRSELTTGHHRLSDSFIGDKLDVPQTWLELLQFRHHSTSTKPCLGSSQFWSQLLSVPIVAANFTRDYVELTACLYSTQAHALALLGIAGMELASRASLRYRRLG